LEKQIESKRKINAQLLTRINLSNQRIVKSRNTLEKISKAGIDEHILRGDKVN